MRTIGEELVDLWGWKRYVQFAIRSVAYNHGEPVSKEFLDHYFYGMDISWETIQNEAELMGYQIY